MMAPVKKKQRSENPPDKKVADILQAFQELAKDGAMEDELFQDIKSRYEPLNEDEKERLFRRIIEEIEVSKEEVKPLLEELATLDTDDPKDSDAP